MSRPKFTEIVARLPTFVPFVGPEAQERALGQKFRARLGANESVFGPSPKAIAAMEAAARENWMYSDPESFELVDAIADHHGVDSGNVVIGEGIDGLLGLTVKMFVEPDQVVVTSDGAYPTFNFHVTSHGARLIKVPFVDNKEHLDGLVTAAHAHNAQVVYVSNPNNPMGTWWRATDIVALRAQLPHETLLILDEAYADTAPVDAIPALDVQTGDVIRYRTFSKAYGLAGARIGYALADQPIIAAFEKVRNHYGINRVGQIGALAALLDQAYLAETVAQIAASRQRLYDIADDLGLSAVPSATNFVAIDIGCSRKAADVLTGLLNLGVFVRRPSVAPLDRHIRVSCGTEDDIVIFAAALKEVLARL